MKDWLSKRDKKSKISIAEKEKMSVLTGLTISQVKNWIYNHSKKQKTKRVKKMCERNLKILEHYFRHHKKPNKIIINDIIELTGFKYEKIYFWFLYRRRVHLKKLFETLKNNINKN